RAEEAIRAFLQRECPAHGIGVEEDVESPGDGRHRWILDPIDGTKSFVHRVPLFGTLVALERDGEPVVGVIACHAAGETVSAAKGLGASKADGRPARVSSVATLSQATVSTTSYSRLAKDFPAGFQRLVASGALLRTWGDCYGYLLVATGRADAMLDPEMNLWDVAALYPIINEAGGRISTWDGSPGPGGSSIASNGVLHPAVLAAIHG
ncbi:MAG: inositol monophosphatase family protein, partial [Dehalococcoidia bacterium]